MVAEGCGAWRRLEGLSEEGRGAEGVWCGAVGNWRGAGGAVGVGRLGDWEIFVIGVGCANRHFILRRICGKSPDGANTHEACLAAGWLGAVRMRGEDGYFILRWIRGKSPVGANTHEACLLDGWLGVVRLRGKEDGVNGVAAVVVGCPVGAGANTREACLVAIWFRMALLGRDERIS